MARYSDLEKAALDYAELDNRETALRKELADVVAAKALQVQHLASFATGGRRSSATTASSVAVASDVKEQVFQMLSGEPSRVFSTAEVIRKRGLKRSTVSVYLSELVTEKRIRRVSKGKYQAVQHDVRHESTARVVDDAKEGDDAALPARILGLMNLDPKSSFDAPAIAKRIGAPDAVNSVRGALSRLARAKRVQKVKHGTYKAITPVA